MSLTSAILCRVPSDIISDILSHLETIQELGIAIRSHRVFLDAFHDGPYFIARTIVQRQIPEQVVPFIIALWESSRISQKDAILRRREVLEHLAEAISDPGQTTASSLASLSLPDLAFCSLNYAAADSLAKMMADEVKPMATSTIGLPCPSSPHLTFTERTRLVRAFLRFQLMCNLLCPSYRSSPSDGVNGGTSLVDAELDSLVILYFSMFSPWVNDQLMSVHVWLQRILCKAFDNLAWHDVDWGELPVEITEPGESSRFQWFLSSGLPFLHDVARADSYAAQAQLLQLVNYESRDPDWDPSSQLHYGRLLEPQIVASLDDLGVQDVPLRDWAADQLRQLARQGDGAQDSTDSSSCLIWLGANAGRSMGEHEDVDDADDINLWQCGYNIWEWSCQGDSPPIEAIKAICNEVRAKPSLFERLGSRWDYEVLSRSQRQRTDIWLAGGSGYWPTHGIDFSGIKGLSPESISRLLDKWGKEIGA